MNIPIPSAAPAPTPTGFPVPLDALNQPDDQEQMQTPAVGDSITIQVDAKILSVDGETAMIQPTAINGKPLEDAESPDEAGEQPVDPAAAETDLRSAMGQQNEQA